MALSRKYANKHAKVKRRQRLNAKARHQRQQHQAQRAINALHDLGLPDNLVLEIAGRLQAHQKLLGKVFGLMFPTLFGCTSVYELTRVRGWDKNLPSRILGALPKRSWLKRLRKLGHDILVPLWHHAQSMSAATQSRWQWSWVWDDSVFVNTVRTLHWWAAGTVASTNASSVALMASCSSWSWAMAN